VKLKKKIHENHKFIRYSSRFNENKEYLQECFEQFAHICDQKNVYPDLEFRAIDICTQKGFFIDKEELEQASQNEIKLQKTIFSE
jgi:hypothetical protein